MKHVNKTTGRDGVVRLYLRKAGMPSIPLKSPWPGKGQEAGSALEREVQALVAAAGPKATPSTLRAALRAYELDSPDFRALAPSTKETYLGLIKELDEDFGDLPVSTFNAEYLLQLRTIWARRGYRVPGHFLTVLRNALLPAIITGKLGGGDPFALIPGVRRPHDMGEPHVIWPESVVHRVIELAIREGRFGLARAVAIGRYAGPRRADIVKLTKAARKGGRFVFTSGKRKVPVSMPEDPALAAVLDGTPDHPDSLVLAYNLSGYAYTEDGFHQELVKLVKKLATAKEDPIDCDDYTAHGLRHTFGVESALAGCTDAEGAARMGHGSPNSFATYRRQADRIRMSDTGADLVAKLRERSGNGNVQNILQNICKTDTLTPAKGRGKSAKKSR